MIILHEDLKIFGQMTERFPSIRPLFDRIKSVFSNKDAKLAALVSSFSQGGGSGSQNRKSPGDVKTPISSSFANLFSNSTHYLNNNNTGGQRQSSHLGNNQ